MENKDYTVLYLYIGGGLACMALAGYMALKQIDGWGWFLFVGILIIGSISYSKKDNEKDTEEDE